MLVDKCEGKMYQDLACLSLQIFNKALIITSLWDSFPQEWSNLAISVFSIGKLTLHKMENLSPGYRSLL